MNKIEEFVADIEKANTVRAYRQHINSYFSILKTDPEKYFDNGRDYNQDFLEFARAIHDLSPCTRAARLNVVKLFLEENDVPVSRKILKKTIKRIRAKPLTHDTIPTNTELKAILQHGTIKDRSLFLFTATSGMRVDEALKLELEDIDLTHDPVKIRIRGEIAKNGSPRISFISSEAKESLLEWLKVRDDYLRQACAKTINSPFAHQKDANDKTIFCFSYHTALRMWTRLITKSGYNQRDRSTGRYIIHIHSLRKWFETRMSMAGIPEAIYQQLEGHEGYMNGSYKRYTDQEFAEYYQKGVKSLLLFEKESTDVTDIKILLQEKDLEIKDLKQQLDDINKRLDKGVSLYLAQELEKLRKKK